MRCGAVHKLMVRYATEGVDPAAEAEFRAHLDGCAKCRADWAEIEEANAALALYDQPLPDDAFFDRMTHAIMAATETAPAPASRSPFRLRWATASALACLVLAVGFWRAGGGPQPVAPSPETSVATRLAAAEPEVPTPAPAARPSDPTPAPAPAPTKPAVSAPPAQPADTRRPAVARPRTGRHTTSAGPRPAGAGTRLASAGRRNGVSPSPTPALIARATFSAPPAAERVADVTASVSPSPALGSTMRNMSLAALALAAAPETLGAEATSETLMLAMAPEVEDLGSATLVVSSAETPAPAKPESVATVLTAKPEHKRSVLLAVAVVGATAAAPEAPSDQP